MAADDAPGTTTALTIRVAYSPRARVVDEVTLRLAPGATVAEALAASGLEARYPAVAFDGLLVGIWGAFRARSDVLRDQDRVEVYRPLLVDPKEARRARQRKQGKRT